MSTLSLVLITMLAGCAGGAGFGAILILFCEWDERREQRKILAAAKFVGEGMQPRGAFRAGQWPGTDA